MFASPCRVGATQLQFLAADAEPLRTVLPFTFRKGAVSSVCITGEVSVSVRSSSFGCHLLVLVYS